MTFRGEQEEKIAKAGTTAAAGAAGTVYGGPAVGAASAQGASSLCDCCCGNSSKASDQKDAINQQHPLTGDPAADAAIQKRRDQEYLDWVHKNDVQAFETLPEDTKALLPAMKQFADSVYSQIPEADRNLTLGEAVAKYPELANAAYAKIQEAVPSLKNMPLDYAMALAKASGADKVTLSEIKDRIDFVAENAPSAQKYMGSSNVGTLVMGVGGLLALLGAVTWFAKRSRKASRKAAPVAPVPALAANPRRRRRK